MQPKRFWQPPDRLHAETLLKASPIMTIQKTTDAKTQLAALLAGMTAGDKESLIRSMGVEVVPTTATVTASDDFKGKQMVQILVPGARPMKMTKDKFVRLFVDELSDVIRSAQSAGIIN